jgi:hypothetical protein
VFDCSLRSLRLALLGPLATRSLVQDSGAPACSDTAARDVDRSGVVTDDGYSFHMRSEELPTKPVLVRELIGESLREERVSQGKTLREVSRKARVSLGYLSEVERGQKEASRGTGSAALCGAQRGQRKDGRLRRRDSTAQRTSHGSGRRLRACPLCS